MMPTHDGQGSCPSRERPLPLMADLVRYIAPKGGTVLDPCMGSSSTVEACLRGRYGFTGAEIDHKYLRAAAKGLRTAVAVNLHRPKS